MGLMSFLHDAQALGQGGTGRPLDSQWPGTALVGPVAVTTDPIPNPSPRQACREQPCSHLPPVHTEGWINFPVSLSLSSL